MSCVGEIKAVRWRDQVMSALRDDLVRSGAAVPSQRPSWWVVWHGLLEAQPLAARQGGKGPLGDSEASVIHSLFSPNNLSVEG